MQLKTRKRTQPKQHQQQLAPGAAADPEINDGDNVLVSYGIHRGRFPVGGLTVRQARDMLRRLLRIHPTAVAVINGNRVDEDEVISENVSMLSFVKPSSIKG